MSDLSKIEKGMTVIGADGANVGTVAGVVGARIKLEPASDTDHNRFIPGGLVANLEGSTVRLSPTGANAVLFDEEADGSMAD